MDPTIIVEIVLAITSGVLTLVCAVGGYFLRQVLEDVRTLRTQVTVLETRPAITVATPDYEARGRLSVLETNVAGNTDEIDGLRKERHTLREKMTPLLLQEGNNAKDIERLEGTLSSLREMVLALKDGRIPWGK